MSDLRDRAGAAEPEDLARLFLDRASAGEARPVSPPCAQRPVAPAAASSARNRDRVALPPAPARRRSAATAPDLRISAAFIVDGGRSSGRMTAMAPASLARTAPHRPQRQQRTDAWSRQTSCSAA